MDKYALSLFVTDACKLQCPFSGTELTSCPFSGGSSEQKQKLIAFAQSLNSESDFIACPFHGPSIAIRETALAKMAADPKWSQIFNMLKTSPDLPQSMEPSSSFTSVDGTVVAACPFTSCKSHADVADRLKELPQEQQLFWRGIIKSMLDDDLERTEPMEDGVVIVDEPFATPEAVSHKRCPFVGCHTHEEAVQRLQAISSSNPLWREFLIEFAGHKMLMGETTQYYQK